MDFAETEEQQMIRDMVRDFAESVAAPTATERDREQRPPVAEFKDFAASASIQTINFKKLF